MKTRQDVIDWLEEHRVDFIAISDEIWAHPELGFEEFRASKLQTDYLEERGFTITWDIGGISTAFIAEWGQGKPVLGFAGEYDALPGLSQKMSSSPEAIEEGAPGHGCGHNLLGTGCLAGATAVKEWLQATGHTGTVRYYGCPAEEKGSGKVFMAAEGAFDDLDAVFNYHPGRVNQAEKGSNLGVNDVRFRFHGRTSHAGSSPHLGRSALDAVELTNIGVNFLREHVLDDVRLHYVITDGGEVPNIVPETAEVWYFIRAHLPEEVAEVTERVRKIAQGAALMTETELEEIWDPGVACLLSNHALADLQYEAMQVVGPIEFDPAEKAFAKEINDNYPPGTKEALAKISDIPIEKLTESVIGDVFPCLDEGKVHHGSTDVGDLSWIAPLSMLETACYPVGAPGHSWGVVASSGSSIGHKGMLFAAKVMAITAIELYQNPDKLAAVRQEFEAVRTKRKYNVMLPQGVTPPQYQHPYR